MADYRLTLRAEADLIAIYHSSERTFGAYQADAYAEGLNRTFGLIADFPGIGKGVDEIKSGYRRFRFQSHYIFYTVELGQVLIRALVHTRRNVRDELFE